MDKTDKELERFDDTYWVRDVCPYCNHSKIVEITEKGNFWSGTITKKHYKCSRCSREFKHKSMFIAVPNSRYTNMKKEVKRLIQGNIDGTITQKEMAEGFDKIGIYIYIPTYKSVVKK